MCCYFIFKQTNKKSVHSRLSLRKSCILTLSTDRLSLLLLSRKPIQLKTRSACVLVAGTQRNFLASLTRFGYCSCLPLHQPRGSRSCTCKDDKMEKQYNFWILNIKSVSNISCSASIASSSSPDSQDLSKYMFLKQTNKQTNNQTFLSLAIVKAELAVHIASVHFSSCNPKLEKFPGQALGILQDHLCLNVRFAHPLKLAVPMVDQDWIKFQDILNGSWRK